MKNSKCAGVVVVFITLALAACDTVSSNSESEVDDGNSSEEIASGEIERMWTFASGKSGVYGAAELQTSWGNDVILVVKLEGDEWKPVGTHRFSNWVSAVAVSEPYVYVAENASRSPGDPVLGRVYRWDGLTWAQLGSSLNGRALSLAADGETVYAGGTFEDVDGQTFNNVARWNGSDWEPLSAGLTLAEGEHSTTVEAMIIRGSDLYVAGRFDRADHSDSPFVAKWNGAEWEGMPGLRPRPGASPGSFRIWDIMADEQKLYAIGQNVNLTGGDSEFPLLLWEDGTWKDAGPSVIGFTLAKAGALLFAGGFPGGITNEQQLRQKAGVFTWDGNDMAVALERPETQFTEMTASGGTVFVAGIGTVVSDDGVAPEYVSRRWNGSQWVNIGEVDISSLE